MKKLLLLTFTLGICYNAISQIFVTGAHVKMSDVIDFYKKYQQPYMNDQKDPDAKRTGLGNQKFNEKLENKDYHFDRWKWYWQQHTDGNGYLVSPAKTYTSWKKYKMEQAVSRTASASTANWVFQGDDSSGADGSGVGRIAVVAFHPTDANTYWIGSAGGGAWKTTNNGLTWTNMTDQLPELSISDIKFNYRNPNTVYLCTGDRDAGDYYSIGLMKSYDGGATWNTTGIAWNEDQFHLANALLVNPLDSNSLIFASDSGIFKSFDGGATWTAPLALGDFKQLVYHPTDTNIVYATSHYNYITSGAAQIYRSADGGMTWTQVTTLTDAFRITLAVTPANTGIVKAIVAASDNTNMYGLEGIYNSTDTGNTFTEIFSTGSCSSGNHNLLSFNADGTQCGGQGFYDLAFAIDPANANNVYCGGINGWRSTNGGMTWHIMNQWDNSLPGVVTIHADKHFMGFNPLTPGRFFETNDGGIYWSDSPTSTGTWNDITNGLGITEFYRVAVSDLATYEIAGAQDVGSKYIQNFQYQDITGGDGMECQMDPLDSTVLYSSSEYGNIFSVNTLAGSGGYISGNIPGTPSGGWITPFIIEPTCHTCLIAGYQDVYVTSDEGNTWTDISGALTSGDLLRVAVAASDTNTIYAVDDPTATFTTKVYYTHDRTTWNTITAPYSGQNISDILVDPKNANSIYLTFGGYAGYSSPQVVNYNVSTAHWTSYNTNLPDVPVNCIKLDTQNKTMYVGTDIGVFYRDSTMTKWESYTTGLPVVAVYDLQINYATSTLWAATFGRSLWSSPRHTMPAGPNSVASISAVASGMSILPNPNKGNFTISFNGAVTDKSVRLEIIDARGTLVWKATEAVNGSAVIVNAALAPGNYILEAISPKTGIIGREKIVVE